MGCVHSTGTRTAKKHGSDAEQEEIHKNTPDCELDPEILQLTELAKGEHHAFTEKSFRTKRACDVCRQNIDNPGAFCKDCKVAVHKKCENKVTTTCISAPDLGATKSTSQKKRCSLPRSKSVERVMERVMERHYDFDLTYITERIISVFFLPDLEEQRYRRNLQEVAAMLKSKHQDKFLLLNLSEKRHDITRLNPKVQDYGWPDLHAPPLDRISAVCKAMETWLSSDPNNVVVLHCKGNKGKTGVIVAAYMHYSKISAGADQALTTLAMRKFCEDKVSTSLQPSQNRYIYYFGGLLSGSIKMNSSPLFLHQILLPSLPNFQVGGGYYPFLKIYQSLQLVYTSGIYDPQGSTARKLCVAMEPALLLKGDIMVKCYHRRPRGSEREVVFRVQFHTCTVHGAQLWFGKTELDVACTDDRFPPDATVEFVFSNGPEKIKGRECHKNDSAIKVDYNISDPVVRWDSYENFNLHHQDSLENISHTKGPLDGSLYAQVRKRRGPCSAASGGGSPNGCLPDGPTVKPQTPCSQTRTQPHGQPLSFSSDSGHSSAQSDHLEEPSPSSSWQDGEEERKCPSTRGEGENKAKGKERDRETAILDDGDLSSPGGLRRSSCGRCGEGGQKAERERCLAKCHCCSGTKNNPKSRTLPALPSKSVSPPLCHRHSAHPLPELPWERPPVPLPCLHGPCYPYPPPEHVAHPHSHTLPASNRLCAGGEDCHLFHYSGHGPPSSRLSHQSLPSSPYREVFFGPPAVATTTPPGCPCQDCTNRREHQQSAAVRTFHPLHPEQIESPHWAREAAGVVPRVRQWEAEQHPWEAEREAEFWQRRAAGGVPSYHHACHAHLEQRQSLEGRGFVFGPHLQGYGGGGGPHSLVDMRDGTSSGYSTPPAPRHSCPCSPYQASPAESHESRGYVSGYQSGSASPLPPAASPNRASPGRGGVPESPLLSGVPAQQRPESHVEDHTQADVEDHVSQGSAEKSDSNGQGTCSTPGLDSDQDYTVISSSPTHTEDSVTEEKLADGPEQRSSPQNQDPNQGTSASASVDSNANSDSPATQTPTEMTAPSQSSSSASPKDSPQTGHLSPGSSKNAEENATGGSDGRSPSETSTRTPVPRPRSIQPVQIQMQINGSAIPGDQSQCDNSSRGPESLSPSSSHGSTPTSPNGTPDGRPSPQADAKPPSPVPDGYCTPTFPMASYYYPLLNVPRVPYTGYTAVTIPAAQPPLPEKKRLLSNTQGGGAPQNGHNSLLRVSSAPSPPSPPHHVTFSSTSAGDAPPPARRGSTQSETDRDSRVNAKFVQDSSKYWYKPGISRDQAIAVLKDKQPGAFLIRDSNSFQGAYGLALKVVTPPPNANLTGIKGDPLEQLVRHFLIETGPRGVKIKGCQNESYFGSLSALVYQHSITPISLPCALRVPEKDLVGELQEIQSATSTSTAADLLKQGAACNVLYLNSVETESLTGPQAISKATKCTLALSPRPTATVVHFKVSAQGITLTDSKRRLFFRRHYPINSVTFSSLDPQDQRWINSDSTSCKMFGFVARRTGSATENVCHLFAEMDPEQPAVAIVNFINKVMLGLQQRR